MGYIKSITEITEEEYNKLIILENNDRKSFHEMIESIACRSNFSPNAYGCDIPMRAYEEDGKYYASWHRWDSCD
jgi:hypothetical protein